MTSNYRLPGYTERDLQAFEWLNEITIPKDLYAHLLKTKTIERKSISSGFVRHFVDLYKGNPFDFSNNWIRNGNRKVYLPINHPFFPNCITKQTTATTQYWKEKFNEDVVEIDMEEYLFQIALSKEDAIPEMEKTNKIMLMEHGCGEYDAIDLNTGIVHCRDYYNDTGNWHNHEYPNFTEWLKHSLGECNKNQVVKIEK